METLERSALLRQRWKQAILRNRFRISDQRIWRSWADRYGVDPGALRRRRMSILFVVGLGIVGLVLLTVGADQLVVGAGRLATVLRVAPVVVGVVIIGLGTSAPEFVVSGTAAVRGNAALALGNLVGSNMLNVTLILGVVAVVSPVVVRSSVPVREAPLMVAGVTVFGAFALVGLKFVAGVLLAVLSFGALALLVRLSRVPLDDPL